MVCFRQRELAQEPLYQNNSLENTFGILFFPPDASPEEITEGAVALKNSLSGDIFVGVEAGGTLVGSRVSRDTLNQKRDKLVRVLNGMLPNANEGISICVSAAQAHEFVEEKKDFVAGMWLQSETTSSVEEIKETEEVSIFFRIHVIKGTSTVHFAKLEHTRAFTRVGTETQKMVNHEDLFNRLELLASRNVSNITETCIKEEVKKASTYNVTGDKYKLFENVRIETE